MSESATDSDLLSLVVQTLESRLPQTWLIETEGAREIAGELRRDLVITVSAPDGVRTHP